MRVWRADPERYDDGSLSGASLNRPALQTLLTDIGAGKIDIDAVRAKLAANAVERRIRANGSPAILAGRIFDDRGNRMSPTHSNKRGVRYRYYVSQPLVQKRQQDAGTVARVAGP